MYRLYTKLINSKIYLVIKKIITLNGDKRLIVPSLTFYIIIGLVPFSTLTFFFLKMFGLEENYLLDILKHFFPEIIDTIKENSNIYEGKNIITTITSIISIYIASKGTLNYLYYLEDKYNLPHFRYHFISSRLYAIILTTATSLFFAFINSFIIYLERLNTSLLNPLIFILNNSYVFIIILIFNYLLTKRKIPIKNLLIGSYLTSFLFSISRYILSYIIYTSSNKEKYYGFLTNFIVAILFLKLLVYFFAIGNEINCYLFYKKSGQTTADK